MKKITIQSILTILFLAFMFTAHGIRAQNVNKKASSFEEEDADLPPFANGTISKDEYLKLRSQYFEAFHESAIDLPYNPRVKAIQEMEQQIQANWNAVNKSGWATIGSGWVNIGPDPIPNGQTTTISTPVNGRTISIAVDPTNADIAYVGTAQGGVYRTKDGGATWTAIFDDAASLAIGALALAPSNPTILYVGTGEPNLSCDSYFGVGVYRIDNADTSPILTGPINPSVTTGIIGTTAFTGRSIAKILVHPTDPATIFVCTTSGIGGIGCNSLSTTAPPLALRGIYRSTNATSSLASITFEKLTVTTAGSVGLDVTGNRSITDMVFEPGNIDNIICWVLGNASAGDGGMYRSVNALSATPTFTQVLTTTTNSARGELSINKVGSVVTVIAATGEGSGSTAGRIRKSIDGGATWSGTLAGGSGYCGGQCFYDIAVKLHPNNSKKILLGGSAGDGLYQISLDGGTTFLPSAVGLHADVHVIEMAPSDTNRVYLGCDGGIFKSDDGGVTWTSINTAGFSAMQYQSIAIHPTDPNFTIGGTQDNGTQYYNPSASWSRIDFGDGGYSLIDQNAVNTTNVTMYHTYFNQINAMAFARVLTPASAGDGLWPYFGCGFGGVTPNGMTCSASAILFYAPMALGPGNPNTLYFGSDVLYRSTNQGTTMSKVSQEPIVSGVAITSIGIAPLDDNVRIVGLRNGGVYRTVTGANPLVNVSSASFPPNYVSRTVIDPANSDIAYVTFAGFGVNAGEHIWKTTNLSNATPTWVAAGSGIPDIPVNAFVIDPANSNNLYAGTDIGVYFSTNGGTSWLPFSSGLPRVAVFDMAFQNANRFLRIATHGRGIWNNTDAPLPVELVSFNANSTKNGVSLDWITATEVNNYGFDIERSVVHNDEIYKWQKIGFIEGHGNSNSTKTYSYTDNYLVGGTKFVYRLKQIDIDGKYQYSPVQEAAIIVNNYSLSQNYPNPFNPTTKIRFSIPQNEFVSITLYNSIGEKTADILRATKLAGNHEVEFNASSLANGVYFYTLNAGNYVETKKMILLK